MDVKHTLLEVIAQLVKKDFTIKILLLEILRNVLNVKLHLVQTVIIKLHQICANHVSQDFNYILTLMELTLVNHANTVAHLAIPRELNVLHVFLDFIYKIMLAKMLEQTVLFGT